MSVYIAAGRTVEDKREVLVKADLYDSRGQCIGERCYGWHPEHNVTFNGVDVCEIWLKSFKNCCEITMFTRYFA